MAVDDDAKYFVPIFLLLVMGLFFLVLSRSSGAIHGREAVSSSSSDAIIRSSDLSNMKFHVLSHRLKQIYPRTPPPKSNVPAHFKMPPFRMVQPSPPPPSPPPPLALALTPADPPPAEPQFVPPPQPPMLT